jgi:Reverse transcriptase (RNA-dependent DNA polymerase)/RNase H-like domain found in reverse transcriptase
MMNDIFKDLMESRKVIVYLDNILIHTAELLKDHISMVQRVLQVLRTHQLYLKPEKCKFHKQEVEYLGHIVSKGTVLMDPTKVAAVQNWPTPNTKKELQQFLGFTNYYCQFIQDYSKIAKPLNELVVKNPWKWSTAQIDVFDMLQNALASANSLSLPTEDGQYHIHSDASLIGSSATLEQFQMAKW